MRCTIRGGNFCCVSLLRESCSCSLVLVARQAVLSGWLRVPRLLFLLMWAAYKTNQRVNEQKQQTGDTEPAAPSALPGP